MNTNAATLHARTRVLLGIAIAAGLSFSCGGGTTTAPTLPSSPAAAGELAAAQSTATATTTWSCFTGSSTGAFAPAGCGNGLSSAIRAITPSAVAGAPATPAALQFSVSGSTVTLNWTYIPGNNPDASSFVVEAGASSGLSNLASFDTGGRSTSLVVQQVPSGTYFVRVRSRNANGSSDASNEVILTVSGGGPAPCTFAPGAPTSLAATVNGSTVTLTWTPPGGGCAPTTYDIEAGSSPGGSDLARVHTGNPSTSFTATSVPGGTYYVRVSAGNGNSIGNPSNEITLVIAGGPSTSCAGTPCTFATPGSYTFTVPAGVTSLTVQAWGGGGGAGGGCGNTGTAASTGGAGGGGGGYSSTTVSVSAGQTFSLTVAGPGDSGSIATAGGASTFGTALVANGGGGGGTPGRRGSGCPNSSPGGSGGTASGGTTNISGGNGTAGTVNGVGGSGGNAGGPGGGAGGVGGPLPNGSGGNGAIPGGGAGGDCCGGDTGVAARGQVIIAWR
jgi:hypothetical protein